MRTRRSLSREGRVGLDRNSAGFQQLIKTPPPKISAGRPCPFFSTTTSSYSISAIFAAHESQSSRRLLILGDDEKKCGDGFQNRPAGPPPHPLIEAPEVVVEMC